MSDKREYLKSMLNNLINDNQAEAAVDSHNYFSLKMKELLGGKQPTEDPTAVETQTEDQTVTTD